MADKYTLNAEGEPVPCSLETWAQQFERLDMRRVGDDEPVPGVRVSTVFIGLDYSFNGGPPLVFETMILGGGHDEFQERCTTLAQAKDMHARAVKLVTDTVFP